jgi:hypothetical protein
MPGEHAELLLIRRGKTRIYLVHFADASEERVDLQNVRGRAEGGRCVRRNA